MATCIPFLVSGHESNGYFGFARGLGQQHNLGSISSICIFSTFSLSCIVRASPLLWIARGTVDQIGHDSPAEALQRGEPEGLGRPEQ